jgi:hypothetical protein
MLVLHLHLLYVIERRYVGFVELCVVHVPWMLCKDIMDFGILACVETIIVWGMLLIVRVGTQLGTPRGRYDEHSSKSSVSMKPRFIEPVGERTNFQRLMLVGLATTLDNLYMAPYLGHSFAPTSTWNLHTRQPKYFAPTCSEVVNLTSLL